MTALDPLAVALDRFDVPAISAGLVDRIVGAATTTPVPPSRQGRDRRGMWRRGRQAVLGSAAIVLFSAGAVASGLLGRVGIEVPVLTAMLAPVAKSSVKHAAVHKAEVKHSVQKPNVETPPAAFPVMTPAGMPPAPLLLANTVERAERRQARRQFAAEHPAIAANIRHRVLQRLQERALARRAALAGPGDSVRPGAEPTDPVVRGDLAREDARDRKRAVMIVDRRIAAWNARREGTTRGGNPAGAQDILVPQRENDAATPEAGIATSPYRSWSELSPAERQQRIERLRSRRARGNLRALREGNPRPVR